MSNNVYAVRDENLRKLGFRSYLEYLRSETWRQIRAKVLNRDGWLCRRCGKRANQVHHTSYGICTLQGTSTARLFSVCRRCHKAIELNCGTKRDGSESIHYVDWLPPAPQVARKRAAMQKRLAK